MSESEIDSKPPAQMQAFTFGDPVPVLDVREVLDYVEAWFNGRWYETPVPLEDLARTLRANGHHASAIHFKRNMLVRNYVPHPLLPPRATPLK